MIRRRPLDFSCLGFLTTVGILVTVGMPATTAVAQDSIAEPGTDGPEIVDQWQYTLRRPARNWTATNFDDSGWTEGWGGFGSRGTPGARLGTPWQSPAIWLRKSFSLKEIPERPALLIHRDENARVFLNGELVGEFKGFSLEYQVIELEPDARALLNRGENVLAVHCRQTTGGQFIDVHLIDADRVPELPEPKRNPKPFVSELMTEWGQQVTAENAWTEYPRPAFQRTGWTNLNGRWDYAITPIDQTGAPTNWDGQILVPFSLESKLGGVQRKLHPSEALWYHRVFEAAPEQRTLLNFEAVDYDCEIRVNGTSVGRHRGGNTPFSIDITDAVAAGKNELVVRVEDQQEGFQLNGKQSLNPRGIWYTQVSGIWQTVWLESVPEEALIDAQITTSLDPDCIRVKPITSPAAASRDVRVSVFDGGKRIFVAEGPAGEVLECVVPDAKRWSPGTPHLYQLTLELLDDNRNVIDQVKSYAGIRSVGKARSADGHWRMTLNGEPLFHWGPLDQGWWPDGLMTPPSDEAMAFEIGWLKSAGFNMIRKHIKVEPRRYYYHCDRLGMLVWQDHVSGGPQPKWTRLKPNPTDADWPDEPHRQFMIELKEMIDLLDHHPSIVMWVPFNERWGQHRTMEVGKWVVDYDPSRLVNIASGGNFWPVGDLVDAHHYPEAAFPFDQDGGRFDGFIKVVGEFGGHGYPVREHLWNPDTRNWGYGGLPENRQEYRERYLATLDQLDQLRDRGIAAGVYTQTTDVEGEVNGLMTYDRKVFKIPAEELAELHARLFESND